MKLTTIIGTAIAAVALAACGSTAVATTVRPTLAPTGIPTGAPTVSPTTAPTATPTPAATACPPQNQSGDVAGVQCPVVTVTSCDASLTSAGNDGGSVAYTGALDDDALVIEPGAITVNPTGTSGTYGPLLQGVYTFQFRTGAGADISTDGASGLFTIAACSLPPSWGFTTTCANPGTAQGGSLIITFSNGTPDTVVIDGNTVAVSSTPFTSGPYTVGNHSVTLEGFDAPFTIRAC
jgi:hypothetical protein